jgi:hypothetical protein
MAVDQRSPGHAARAACLSLAFLVLMFFLSLAFSELLQNGSRHPNPNRLSLRPANASQRAHAIQQRNQSPEHGPEEDWGLGGRVERFIAQERLVSLIGQTRVHLDAVKGLGSFLELEVVLRDGHLPAEGHAIALDLM